MPQYLQFRLPDVGEGLTEADIVEWKVAVGDTVTVNQEIIEIETAKSLVELPCPYAGVVNELLVEVGQTVEVGSPIIVIDSDPDGPPAPDAEPGEQEPGGVSADSAAEDAQDRLTQSETRSAEAQRPAEAQGSDAQSGAPRAGAAASRATESGTAAAGAAGPGEAETSGGVLVGYGTKHASARRRRRKDTPFASDESARAHVPSGPDSRAGEGLVLAKPPVRKFAKDLGIDLARVPGTGPGGIVTREDVEAAAAQEEPAGLATYPDDDRPWLDGGTVSDDGRQTRIAVRSVRRRTAEAMVASAFTAPHVTVFSTVDVTRTMKLVERLREDRDFADVRVTPLLIAAKALLLAIRRNPTISAAWDDETQEIIYKHYVNLGIAAATPRGLVVPNIKDAHRMGLHELAGALGELTSTARAGKTTPKAMADGTVTITNIGVFGIDTGTPILNPGESAILAFGAIEKRPWVHKGKLKARWVTQLALSFDHRLVDGELGSRVLADVARVMNDPTQGLVWG